jgi:hypothetical protein
MSASLYAVGIGTTVLGGITQQNLITGSMVRGEGRSGEVYSRIQSLVEQKIVPSFTTTSIAAALTACGALGADIGALSGNLALYAQNRVTGGTFSAGATHRKFVISDGVLFPIQLTCQHRGDATLSYGAVVAYDGSNDPILITDSVALAAYGSDQDERFTLGPVELGGITFDKLQALTIDFGIGAVGEGGDSDLWDTIASIRTIQPAITLSGIDPTWFAAAGVPLEGLAGTHANTAIYLRKRADGSTFVADETEEHILITADGMACIDEAFNASGADSGTTSIRMPLKFDGTNAPLVIDTTAALPA